MKNSFLIFILIFAKISFGQSRGYDLINKKTKQWLHYVMSTHGENSYAKFYLFTKDSMINKKEIIIQENKIKPYLDSLQQIGWSKKIHNQLVKNDYRPTVNLHSVCFNTMIGNDSVFRFVYSITLIDLNSNVTKTQNDTLYGTEKLKVLSTFQNQEYKFDEIRIQKETDILLVTLYSPGLFRTIKENEYTLDFLPAVYYYF